jgi:hypothetical protein
LDAAKSLVNESTPTLKQHFNAVKGFVNEDVVEQDSSIPRHSANQAIGLSKGNPRQLGTLKLLSPQNAPQLNCYEIVPNRSPDLKANRDSFVTFEMRTGKFMGHVAHGAFPTMSIRDQSLDATNTFVNDEQWRTWRSEGPCQ